MEKLESKDKEIFLEQLHSGQTEIFIEFLREKIENVEEILREHALVLEEEILIDMKSLKNV